MLHQRLLRFRFRCHGSFSVPQRSHLVLLLFAALLLSPRARGCRRRLHRPGLPHQAFHRRFHSTTPPERPASCLLAPLRTRSSSLPRSLESVISVHIQHLAGDPFSYFVRGCLTYRLGRRLLLNRSEPCTPALMRVPTLDATPILKFKGNRTRNRRCCRSRECAFSWRHVQQSPAESADFRKYRANSRRTSTPSRKTPGRPSKLEHGLPEVDIYLISMIVLLPSLPPVWLHPYTTTENTRQQVQQSRDEPTHLRTPHQGPLLSSIQGPLTQKQEIPSINGP